MKALRRFFQRLTSWTTSARDEEILRAEIEDHIAMQTADNLRAGMTAIEARRQALLKFGNVDAIKEIYRDQRDSPLWKRSCAIRAMPYVACEGLARLRPPFS